MREKLKKAKEGLSFASGLAFLPFIGLVFYLPELWRQTKIRTRVYFKRNRKNFVYLSVVSLIIASWVVGTGLVIVKPQTVQIVRVPERVGSFIVFEKPEAFVNDTDGTKWFLSWPRIPFTNIGSKEESYSLKEPLEINLKIELFTKSAATGNPADADKVLYLIVSGTGQITDWDAFLSDWKGSFWEMELYPELVKEKNIQRINLVEEMLEKDLSHYFMNTANTSFEDLVARCVYISQIMEKNNLKTPEEIENFIKTQEPWYWDYGPLVIKYLVEDVSKNPYPQYADSTLTAFCMEVEGLEEVLAETDSELSAIEYKINHLSELFGPEAVSKAEVIISQYKEVLKQEDKGFLWSTIEEFKDYLAKGNYSPEESFVSCALFDLEQQKEWDLWLKDYLGQMQKNLKEYFVKHLQLAESEGNNSLWRLAIKETLEKEGNLYELMVNFDMKSFLNWFEQDGGRYFKETKFALLSEYNIFEQNYGLKFDLSFQVVEETIQPKLNLVPVK